MFSSAVILFTASFLLLKTTLALPADTEWCSFWTENFCEVHSGSTDYDIANNGVFQNGGPYFNCRAGDEFSLISYPAGDSSGSNPKHCHVFSKLGPDSCIHLDDLGFTTGDGGYYRLSYDKVCPATSEKREPEPEPEHQKRAPSSTLTKAPRAPANANYLVFYDDPACQQQSGSVHYSIDNDGCFENGGAYAWYEGDSIDWHMEQWTGIDDQQCQGTLETCRTMGDINFWAGPASAAVCVHLDDKGFHTGSGSYRIVAHAGCA